MKINAYFLCASAGLALALLAPSIADAAQQPDHLDARPDFEVASGIANPRLTRTITHQAPAFARKALVGKLAAGTWRVSYDSATGVAAQIYGSGVATPGSVADAAIAERAARALLAEQIGLLAPGSTVNDFELVSNHFDRIGQMRTVGFAQRHQGVPVIGGQVSFRFKNDRLFVITSDALPNVSVSTISVTDATAARTARDWIDNDFSTRSQSGRVGAAVILPIITTGGAVHYYTARPVTVASGNPIGKWSVYVADGNTLVARRQLLRFNGTVRYNAPDRWWGSDRSDYPAAFATVNVDGTNQNADVDGVLTFAGGSAQITTTVDGPFVRVSTDTGGDATDAGTLNSGGSVTWNESASELLDAQLSTFIHANLAKEFARTLNPDLAWLAQAMPARVNIGQNCNAFSDGNSINFFTAGGGCGNTGRMADVVYHEFGHSLHSQSIIPGAGSFDGPFSEGLSDYLAATMTNDPAMGRGFQNNDNPLRHVDDRDRRWPEDIGQAPHTTGLIFAGAMWDLRTALIAEMGQTAGKDHADRLFYAAVQRASGIPSTYVEILAADDDDGNLDNGTPNQCIIEAAFDLHGLVSDVGGVGPGLEYPVRDLFEVAVPTSDNQGASCTPVTVDALDLHWKLRTDAADQGTVRMTLEDNRYVASIPRQAEGVVVQYRINIRYDDASTRDLPLNRAEPYYEFYTGAVQELYCTDFETNPADWNVIGGQWEWGVAPGATASGNPDVAYSGNSIFGTNLSGRYDPQINVAASTPAVDTTGYDNVRVQYQRWLGVEDSTYDRATITANNIVAWNNRSNPAGDLEHQDREWRFHDVDISAQAANSSVAVSFGLTADQGLELAGWNLDDVCVVGAVASVCGDGEATGIEECDDGGANSDSDADACRADCEAATCGDGVTDTGEECDDGNDTDDDDCTNTCVDIGSGCGCESSGSPGSGALLAFGLLVFGYIRRNRHRPTR